MDDFIVLSDPCAAKTRRNKEKGKKERTREQTKSKEAGKEYGLWRRRQRLEKGRKI